MKKKLLVMALIMVSIITLTGCETKKETKKTTPTKDNIKEVNPDTLKSDDQKIVLASDIAKYVFYYEEDKVTAYYIYVDCQTEENAKEILKTRNKTETDKEVFVNGKYLVMEQTEDQYENLRKDDVVKMFSDLKEVK